MVKILKEHQSHVIEYFKEHYENIQVFIHDNWLKLDFNKDGHVTAEDLKKGIQKLYEFMKGYEYFSKAIEIKSKLYSEAIRFMQKDLREDRKKGGAKKGGLT
jgi:glycerol-3-phosphate O-acyltransferase